MPTGIPLSKFLKRIKGPKCLLKLYIDRALVSDTPHPTIALIEGIAAIYPLTKTEVILAAYAVIIEEGFMLGCFSPDGCHTYETHSFNLGAISAAIRDLHPAEREVMEFEIAAYRDHVIRAKTTDLYPWGQKVLCP
jgi:hypothetical protein